MVVCAVHVRAARHSIIIIVIIIIVKKGITHVARAHQTTTDTQTHNHKQQALSVIDPFVRVVGDNPTSKPTDDDDDAKQHTAATQYVHYNNNNNYYYYYYHYY